MGSSPKEFYRRKLPDGCIDFASEEGRNCFIRALNSGHALIYFKLAAQFRTQDEPAYCGLSTLVMVLNALSIDPGRVWKGPWRWYHESMLDCCRPLDEIQKTGITYGQFVCLARCNRLHVKAKYGTAVTIDEFQEDLKASTSSEETVLVSSYDRRVLGQTGSGHFSPLAAYDPETDRVLIMDVARFKYPPHWITVETAYKAMQPIDPTTGRSRGYCLLRTGQQCQLRVLRLKSSMAQFQSEIWRELSLWLNILNRAKSDDTVSQFVEHFQPMINRCIGVRPGVCCHTAKSKEESEAQKFCSASVCAGISKEEPSDDNRGCCSPAHIFDLEFVDALRSGTTYSKIHSLVPDEHSSLLLTALYLAFPYDRVCDSCNASTLSQQLSSIVRRELNSMPRDVQEELQVISCQLEELIRFRRDDQ